MKFLISIGVLVVIVGGLAAIKMKQRWTLSKAMEDFAGPAEVVGTATAREEDWERTVSAVGTVAAVRGVAVSAEVAGGGRASCVRRAASFCRPWGSRCC